MTTRFNYNANTILEAKEYIFARTKQLLRFNFKLVELEEFEWGISAIFAHDNKKFQSLYILNDFRGKGIFKKNVQHKIITSVECGISQYLYDNNISYVEKKLTPFVEYQIISDYYGGEKAKRSGVHLMNHIDEGLYVLEKIGASETAKKAYCLHPIIQSDEALKNNYQLLQNIDTQVAIALTEYRSVANEYLSKRKINSLDEIRLSPLKDVNDMLIADKIQNKKDFDLYHKGTHERSKELSEYFDNWLKKLEVNKKFYSEVIEFCSLK